jgi:hypothetical protein
VFCECFETVDHLFFQCSVAKIVWAIIAKSVGASNIPQNINQCWNWCTVWLPSGSNFHAMGIGAVCWSIWKCRNKIVFDKKLMTNPIEIICQAHAFMKHWSGLYGENDKQFWSDGADHMLKIAKDILATQTARQINHLLLQDGGDNGNNQDEE